MSSDKGCYSIPSAAQRSRRTSVIIAEVEKVKITAETLTQSKFGWKTGVLMNNGKMQGINRQASG